MAWRVLFLGWSNVGGVFGDSFWEKLCDFGLFGELGLLVWLH